MIAFSCAFTGHRPHKFPWGYNEAAPDCVKLKQALAEQITTLANAGILEFLSGMAEGCMLERNRFLVDHAGILLAVYNGEQRGGTAATLRYARKKNRAILILDPLTQSVSREGFAAESAGQ